MSFNFEIIIPPGSYWLGDPCYFVSDEDWDEILKTSEFFTYPSGTVRGYTVYALGTMFGDGTYVGSDGFDYPVDAGVIGLVPVGLAIKPDDKPPAGQLITTNLPTAFGYSNGSIYFGGYSINTSGKYEDDEDE